MFLSVWADAQSVVKFKFCQRGPLIGGVGPCRFGSGKRFVGQIKRGAGKLLEQITLFDVYTGAQIAAGKKSVAFSLTLRAPDRTLTDQEADEAVTKALKELVEVGAALRS